MSAITGEPQGSPAQAPPRKGRHGGPPWWGWLIIGIVGFFGVLVVLAGVGVLKTDTSTAKPPAVAERVIPTPTVPAPVEPAVPVVPAPVEPAPAPEPATPLAMSRAEIRQELVGGTASDGTTVTGVRVLRAWMENGVEAAEVNMSYDDGTVYHNHFVLDPGTGNWHVHTGYQVNSMNDRTGLNDPFTEASVPGANGTEASYNVAA